MRDPRSIPQFPKCYETVMLRLEPIGLTLIGPDSHGPGTQMASIELPNVRRPVFARKLALAGLIPALVLASVVGLWSTEAKKECRGGAFSSGFGAGFDVRHCDLVVKRGGQVIIQLPLSR
jgi:hypothetical protein